MLTQWPFVRQLPHTAPLWPGTQCRLWPGPIAAVIYLPLVHGRLASADDETLRSIRLDEGLVLASGPSS